MSETRTYDPTAAEVAVVQWVREALRAFGLAGDVRIANQGNPRGRLPYVTIELSADRELETASVVATDTDAAGGGKVVEVREVRVATAQISCRGNLAYQQARAVAASLRVESVLEVNAGNGLAVQRELGPIQSVPEIMSTHTEPRRVQDFEIVYCETRELADGIGVVERVIGTGDIYQQNPGDGVTPIVDETAP